MTSNNIPVYIDIYIINKCLQDCCRDVTKSYTLANMMARHRHVVWAYIENGEKKKPNYYRTYMQLWRGIRSYRIMWLFLILAFMYIYLIYNIMVDHILYLLLGETREIILITSCACIHICKVNALWRDTQLYIACHAQIYI